MPRPTSFDAAVRSGFSLRDRHRSNGLVLEVRLAAPTQPSDLVDEHAVRNPIEIRRREGLILPHPRRTAFP